MSECTVAFDDTSGKSEGKLMSGCSGSTTYLMVGHADLGRDGETISESLNAVMSFTAPYLGTCTG